MSKDYPMLTPPADWLTLNFFSSKCHQFMPGMTENGVASPFWGNGFSCECNDGYAFDDAGACVQTDPCLVNHGGCSKHADCDSEIFEDGSTEHECTC